MSYFSKPASLLIIFLLLSSDAFAVRVMKFPSETPVEVPTGSGTANQVAYWSGTTALAGDSGLTYNATTDILTVGKLYVENNVTGITFDAASPTFTTSLKAATAVSTNKQVILPSVNATLAHLGTSSQTFTGGVTFSADLTCTGCINLVTETNGILGVTNGGTGAAPGADDQLLVADSTSAATWRTLTTCTGESKALTYDVTTNAFGCNTITGGITGLTADTGGTTTGTTVTLNGGVGITTNRSSDTIAISADSTEADFLDNGALTCGAATQGKMMVHTTPLQYCDNAATPTLRYAAYGNNTGEATSIANDAVLLATDTQGFYVGSVLDGTGIDGTASGEGSQYTPTLDLTEISSLTWGAGAFTTMTFDAGATDPVLTAASGALTMTTGNLGIATSSKLNLEGAAGDTYLTTDATTTSLEVNGVTLITATSSALTLGTDIPGPIILGDSTLREIYPQTDDKEQLGNSTNGFGDITLSGASTKVVGMNRHGTANTAGNSLTIQSGGATSGATNKATGDLLFTTGVGTGNARPGNITFSAPIGGVASGTTDQTLVFRQILNEHVILTDAVATTIANVTISGVGKVAAGNITYAVEVLNSSSEVQVEVGQASYMIRNGTTGGLAGNTVLKYGNQQTTSSGTLSVTFALSAANPAVLSCNADTSLTPSSGYPRITFSIQNLTQEDISLP